MECGENTLLCVSIYLPNKAQIPFSTFNHSISKEFPSEYTQPRIGSVSSSQLELILRIMEELYLLIKTNDFIKLQMC